MTDGTWRLRIAPETGAVCMSTHDSRFEAHRAVQAWCDRQSFDASFRVDRHSVSENGAVENKSTGTLRDMTGTGLDGALGRAPGRECGSWSAVLVDDEARLRRVLRGIDKLQRSVIVEPESTT